MSDECHGPCDPFCMAKMIGEQFQWVEDVQLNHNELNPGQLNIVIIHSYPETEMIIPAIQGVLLHCIPKGVPWTIQYQQVEPGNSPRDSLN